MKLTHQNDLLIVPTFRQDKTIEYPSHFLQLTLLKNDSLVYLLNDLLYLDYIYPEYPGVKKAVDELFTDVNLFCSIWWTNGN